MRKFCTLLFSCIILLLIATGVVIGAGLYFNSPYPDSLGETFTIEKGNSVAKIAKRLEDSRHIRSYVFFIALTRIFKTEGNLQAGNYYIPPHASSLQIHDLFLSGNQVLNTVTIPEGYTLGQISRLLEQSGIVEANEFLDAAENPELLAQLGIPGDSAQGYIFPDTYRFAQDFPAEKTLQFLVTSFWNHIQEIAPDYKQMTSDMINRKIILASIVEREYRQADEAPYIASVFYNRLNIGMPLQSCATVVYSLTEEYGKPHPSFLTYKDLEVDSLYNTYQHQGLPPAPICNPGETALKSVFFPADTDYLFFVLKDPNDGRHYFSKSLIEHNKAKQFYIKGR